MIKVYSACTDIIFRFFFYHVIVSDFYEIKQQNSSKALTKLSLEGYKIASIETSCLPKLSSSLERLNLHGCDAIIPDGFLPGLTK